MPDAVWVLIPLYGAVTYFLYQMIASASSKSPHRFIASVNASVLVKLFMSACIVDGYLRYLHNCLDWRAIAGYSKG